MNQPSTCRAACWAILVVVAASTASAQTPTETPGLYAQGPLPALPAADADGLLSLGELPDDASAAVSASRVQELETRLAELEFTLSQMQTSAAPAAASSDDSMTTAWGSNGFEAQSANKEFRVHIGGRVQMDAVALSAPDLVLGGVGDDDSVNFRRARLRIDGTMYHTMDWAAEFDFVNAIDVDPTGGGTPVTAFGGDVDHTVAPTDLWWNFSEIPWIQNIRIGNQKEPIGLEHAASSRFLDFMERSYLQDAFYGPFNNGFTPGVALHGHNEGESATWAVGGFKNTQNVFAYDTGDNEYALTGRMTCIPWSACDDQYLVHLGLGSSYRGLDQDANPAVGNLRIRSRASLRNGPGPLNPNLADTNFAGRIFAENEVLVAPEAAIVAGPWHAQVEYVGGFINSNSFTPVGGAPLAPTQSYFQGSYVQVLYFLTGEHRAYDRAEARFTRIVPNRNAVILSQGCGLCGPGAWQAGIRYGYLDLTDAGIDGGYIQDLTLGLNWFLNPHSKLQFNYIVQAVDNTLRDPGGAVTAENDDELTGFGVRFAHDF